MKQTMLKREEALDCFYLAKSSDVYQASKAYLHPEQFREKEKEKTSS